MNGIGRKTPRLFRSWYPSSTSTYGISASLPPEWNIHPSHGSCNGYAIEIFIGKSREATLDGRFVAFSKRIKCTLSPSFLTWANKKFGQPDSGDFYFLWKEGAIDGPPRTREQILEMSNEPGFASWEVSPLSNPADRSPISSISQTQEKEIQPPV